MFPLLGRLEQVLDLRSLWESEASYFTPWLAQEENLALLGDTIGIDLELEAEEKEVGPFRADILCKDTATNAWVLVENQLEQTDHTHLGQLMTYAPKLQATTIVWIASKFREEHRAALDWLNTVTDETVQFFGLEIELWRIGESLIAPKFNMVCKPNDWSKTIASPLGARDVELTETKRLQLEYWTEFWNSARSSNTFLKGTKALPQHWLNCSIGKTSCGLTAVVKMKQGQISAQVTVSGPNGKLFFAALEGDRAAIDQQFGEPLSWEKLVGKKESRIVVRLDGCNPLDRLDWPREHHWLREKMEKLHTVFSPRIKSLTLTQPNEQNLSEHEFDAVSATLSTRGSDIAQRKNESVVRTKRYEPEPVSQNLKDLVETNSYVPIPPPLQNQPIVE